MVMNYISKLYYLFYPFLKLENKEKLIFFLIASFSIFVIFLDVTTISILALIFSPDNNQITSRVEQYLSFFYKKSNFSISYFHFQILIVALILFLRNIFYITQDYFIKAFVFKHYTINSKKLFTLYASSELLKFYKKGIDYYVENLNKETWYCYIGILYGLLYILIDSIYFLIIIFTGFYLVTFNFSINMVFIIILFFSLISVLLITLKKKGADRMYNEQKYFKDTLNILKSYLEIKVYKKVKFFTDSYAKHLKNFSKAIVFQGVSGLVPKALIEFLAAFVLVYYLIYNDLALNFELFSIIAFILFRIAPVVARIIQNISSIFFYFPAAKVLINEHKNYSLKNDNSSKININSKLKSLSIINANFSYGKNKILNNFNYKFLPNNIHGVYGESGKGKTTLLLILSGLIQLESGKLKVNELVYHSKNKIDWHKKLGFMSQYNILIDDSLTHTLFLDKNIDDNLIKDAKKYLIKFNLKKLVKLLNKKYDGEYSLGGMLSGGEKQRLAIIRTILLGQELLIFDEPTSSLDKVNEKIILSEFQKLKKNKIIIISTHKKELKSFFDKIIKL